MQTTEKQTFDSVHSLRSWLISLILENENKYNSPIGYFQLGVNREGEQASLRTALIFDKLLTESGDGFKPTIGIQWVDSVMVDEQALKDFQDKCSSCIGKIPNTSWDTSDSAIESDDFEVTTYITPLFIEKAQSI